MKVVVKILIVLTLLPFLSSCGGGETSGSSTNNDQDTTTETTRTVSGTVNLPEDSPITINDVSVEVLLEEKKPDLSGSFTASVTKDSILDVTVMLSEREGDSLPTVYLFTTLLPSEDNIELSIEETAVSLLMNSLSHEYLTQAGTPAEVKQVIRQYGDSFISHFKEMAANDPYVLNVENLNNVYDQTYIDSALACQQELKNMTEANTSASSAKDNQLSSAVNYNLSSENTDVWRSFSAADTSGILIVKPEQNIDDFIIHEDTGNLDYTNVGGKMTGSIQIENDSMLFAHYKVKDIINGSTLKDIPTSFLETAFNPDLIGPQGGWSSAFWASTGLYKAGFQSVIVEVYTPGVLGGTWDEYRNGPSYPLACRNIYSSILIPVISQIIPVSEQKAKTVFDFMKDYGLFEIPLDKWSYNQWGSGAHDFLKKALEKRVITDVIQKVAEDIVTDPKVLAKLISKGLVKMGTGAKTFELAGMAVDLSKLAADVNSTHMKIEFRVIFPLSISELTPTTLTKVSDEEDNPVYTLKGTGLAPFSFGGIEYIPEIYVESENLEGDDILRIIDPENISANEDGTALEFQLPFGWTEKGSNVAGPIYVNLIHNFVDYNGINEVVRVELPKVAAEDNFKIDIVSDLAIISLSENKVSQYDDLVIYGQGFSASSIGNHVYFIDSKGVKKEAEVEAGDETYLKVIIPKDMWPGKMKVYVELEDHSRSNEKTLDMLPNMVTADPKSNTNFEDSLDVWLLQDQVFDIYYKIDEGEFQPYLPITLNQSAHIYAFARATVDDVNYDSKISDFFYYKCAADETLVNGECVSDSESGVLSCTVTFSLPTDDNYPYGEWSIDTFQAGPRYLEWSYADQEWVDSDLGYTMAHLWLDADNEASGFIKGTNSDQVGGIMFDKLPMVGANKFAVYGTEACSHAAIASPVPGYDYFQGTCHESVSSSASAFIELNCTGSIATPQ